jgi:hypothetical protein
MEMDAITVRYDVFEEPARVLGCMTGTQFGSSIINMPRTVARELAIFQQLSLGNIPSFMRRGIPVSVTASGHSGVFWTMPDYLCIGDDSDFLRMPMRPTTAQRAADLFRATLPTRKMVNDIWKALPIHLSFKAMDWRGKMDSVAYFGEHNAHVQRQLAGRDPGLGVAGHHKDVVVTKDRPPGNVAIYGAHGISGVPIQGPEIQKSAHDITYLDYSHGIRWCFEQMVVDGELMYVIDVLQDPDLCHLISDEGVFSSSDVRYPIEP